MRSEQVSNSSTAGSGKSTLPGLENPGFAAIINSLKDKRRSFQKKDVWFTKELPDILASKSARKYWEQPRKQGSHPSRTSANLIASLERRLGREIENEEFPQIEDAAKYIHRSAKDTQLSPADPAQDPSGCPDVNLALFVESVISGMGLPKNLPGGKMQEIIGRLKGQDISISIDTASPDYALTRRDFLKVIGVLIISFVTAIVYNWTQGGSAGEQNISSTPTPLPSGTLPPPITEVLPTATPKPVETLPPEIPMPKFKFEHVINTPPESIPRERIGDPPDLGTAYQLALWGDSYWQQVFLPAYKGENIQSSVRMSWNSEENIPAPPKYSWGDYIHLSRRQAPNNQYIINMDPDSGKSAYEDVVFQENIKLPNGKTISGIKIFDHQTKGIGILEKIFFTTGPNQKTDLLGRLEAIHGPHVLAEIIDKIYIVIDGKTVISYDPLSLFSGKDPTLGRYENAGFIFNPLIPYNHAQVYVTSSAFQGDANRYQGSVRMDGNLWDELYYRVIGQDFNESVAQNVPILKADSQVRTDFIRKYQQVKDSIIKEEFPIKERALVADSWTKIIDNSGVSRFTFRAPSPKDLENTHLNIKYPEADIPEVNINLSELVGTKNAKISVANRFVSFTTTDNGGLKVDFNQSIPLPQGTKITILMTNKAKAEILWQHREAEIGNLRFGVFHQRLERAQSKDGKQLFNPLPKDFIVSQPMIYIDDPSINVKEFTEDEILGNKGKIVWYRPWHEGNFYLREPNGTLITLSSCLEELGDAAFYGIDAEGKNGFVPAEKAAGDTHKMYYYGRGHYDLVFNDDKLVRVDQIDPENMFVLGYTNSLLTMKKGSQILAMPGSTNFETALVQMTLFGYYIADR